MSRTTFDNSQLSTSRRPPASPTAEPRHVRRPSRTPLELPPPPESWLVRLTDGFLAAVILIVPFIMGGRTPLGELVLVGLAIAAAVAWSLSQIFHSQPRIRWSGVEILFLAAFGLGILQLVPLEQSILDGISPHLSELLPLRAAPLNEADVTASNLPPWRQLSLYPAATRQGLILFGAYCLLFVVTIQRISRGEDVERLLKFVACSAVLMALFGLAQYFLGNGKFFWFFEHPQATTTDFVKGAFSNRNHFAQFLALGTGPLLWLVLRMFQTSDRHRSAARPSADIFSLIVALSLGLVMFAALLSLSRGGAVALFASVAVTLLLSTRAGILNSRVLIALSAAALCLGAGLFLYGQDKVAEKIDELLSADLKRLDHQDGRIDLWKTVIDAGTAFPVIGGGIGSHRELYPAFQHVPAQHDFTHAENGYLQVFEETGAVGLGLMLFGILCCLFWSLRATNPRRSTHAACAAGIAGALTGNALHSCGDFIWYAPGIMAVVVILAASVCRLAQLPRESAPKSRFFPRFAWTGLLLASLTGGTWAAPQLLARVQAEPHWNDYQKLAVVRPEAADAPPEEKPRNPVPQILALRKLVKANPEDARAHARLARLYLMHFHLVQQNSENQMDAEQVRDAVLNSEFASVAAMHEWLDRAFGRPRKLLDLALHHCRESLRHSPLLGDNYLFYAKLRFLEHPHREDLSPFWNQAVLLRPLDGKVLFTVGQEYALALNEEKAYEYWRRAFKTGPNQQRKLIEILSPHMPARTFIEHFEPDVNSSFWLAKAYRDRDQREDYLAALEHYGQASETFAAKADETRAARAWLGAFNVYRELQNDVEARRCIALALEANQNDYEVRYAAGQWALLRQDFPTAEEHLAWCAERRPENEALQSMVRQISHKTLDSKIVEPLGTESPFAGSPFVDSPSDTATETEPLPQNGSETPSAEDRFSEESALPRFR